MRLVDVNSPVKDLTSILLSSKAGADDRNLVNKLSDLLEKCLILDPAKRIKVSDALKHPFLHSTHSQSSSTHSHTHSHSTSTSNSNTNKS